MSSRKSVERVREVFARAQQEQLTLSEIMDAGVKAADVVSALNDGVLRQGVCGFWLARKPDPGFVSVVKSSRAGS